VQEEVGDLAEARGAVGIGRKGGDGLSGEVVGDLMGAFEAEDRRVGGLLLGDVFARGFAESSGGFFDIENVVGYLEGPPNGFAEVAKPGDVFRGSSGADSTCGDRGANERGGFAAVNVFESFGADAFAFGFQVGDLAPDHAVHGSGGSGYFGEDPYTKIGVDRSCADGFKSESQECVTGQNGDGFAELLVASRLPTAEVVVVERRKIIMDEGISVDKFDGASGIEGRRNVGSEDASGFETEDGANAFAAGEDGIAHGFVNRRRRCRGRREKAFQRRVDEFEILVEKIRKSHRGVLRRSGHRAGARWIRLRPRARRARLPLYRQLS